MIEFFRSKLFIYLKSLIFIYLFLFSFSCTKKDTSLPVAEWQDITITLSDFERSYFNAWQQLQGPDSPEKRKRFAQKMIEQQIIARSYQPEHSKELDEKIQKLLKQDQYRFLRKRLLETAIQDTLSNLTNNEIKQALLKKNKALHVKNLFSNDSIFIKNIHSQIKTSGKSLATIVRQLKTDKDQWWDYAEDWIVWGVLDLQTENKLYAMQPYTVSAPVKSILGWHLFEIDSVKVTYNFNKSQNVKEYMDTKSQLKYRKLEKAAAPYVKNLVHSKKLVMSMKTAEKIWRYLQPVYSKTRQQEQILAMNKMMDEIPQEFLSTPVAWVEGKPFTVDAFINAIPDLPRDLIRPNLRNAIETAIRDEILAEEAISKGLINDPVVQEKLKRAKINYQYMAELSRNDSLINKIVENPVDYFSNNKDRYIKSIRSRILKICRNNPQEAVKLAKEISANKNMSMDKYVHNILWVDSKSSLIGEKAANLRINDIYAPIKTDSGYCAILVLEKDIRHFTYDEAKSRVKKDAAKDNFSALHDYLLPKSYSPEQIIFYEDNLSIALTDSSKTIF